MSKRSKGRYHEKVIAELFRQAGWTVHLVQSAIAYNSKTGGYYGRTQDIFGADIFAIKKWHLPILIQVTADSSIGRKAKKFSLYPIPIPIVRVYIFQAKKRSGRWKYRALVLTEKFQIDEMPADDLEVVFEFSEETISRYFETA